MNDAPTAVLDRATTDCALCRRSVLFGEPLLPYSDARSDRPHAVCELCRPRAVARGWSASGEPMHRGGSTRLRVQERAPLELALEPEPELLAPQAAIVERAIGLDARTVDPDPPAELIARMRRQGLELERLRRELDPARRAEERRQAERNVAELRQLRSELRDRDLRIERLQLARHAETSPMRMSGHALDAFNQSSDLERMARIARTLGAPDVNVLDEGPGIPRRVRVTLSWDIAWYEFTVKLDLGAGRASVHETGTGGDPSVLPFERRHANAAWSDSGLKLN
ncbi:MAG: hypothetical protein JWM86_1375 [Thermoleophilia bacterium]|nr:hypothetical protein [Thermoleophilia bacterium]